MSADRIDEVFGVTETFLLLGCATGISAQGKNWHWITVYAGRNSTTQSLSLSRRGSLSSVATSYWSSFAFTRQPDGVLALTGST